jgi:hypothetical protein
MQIYFHLATVKKGNDSITEYFETIKTLGATLAAVGQPLNDFGSVSLLWACVCERVIGLWRGKAAGSVFLNLPMMKVVK